MNIGPLHNTDVNFTYWNASLDSLQSVDDDDIKSKEPSRHQVIPHLKGTQANKLHSFFQVHAKTDG